jgi:hypothetical protein
VYGYTHIGYNKKNELRLAATLKVEIPGFDAKEIDELNKASVFFFLLFLALYTKADCGTVSEIVLTSMSLPFLYFQVKIFWG